MIGKYVFYHSCPALSSGCLGHRWSDTHYNGNHLSLAPKGGSSRCQEFGDVRPAITGRLVGAGEKARTSRYDEVLQLVCIPRW